MDFIDTDIQDYSWIWDNDIGAGAYIVYLWFTGRL